MDRSEFDSFADEYAALHAKSIRLTGELPEFFADYKIREMARELIGTVEARRILDFGGGIGTSVPAVRRHFPAAAVTCIDVSSRSLSLARSRYEDDARFLRFDGRSIPFADESYDVAFAACVFHHIEGAAHTSLLRELGRVLRPGGHLYIFEHNPHNPLTRRAVNTCPFDEYAVLIPGRRMHWLMREAGFADVRLKYRFFFPRSLAAFRRLDPLLTWCPLGGQYSVSGKRVR